MQSPPSELCTKWTACTRQLESIYHAPTVVVPLIPLHYGHLLCTEEVHLPQGKTPLQENRLLTVVAVVVSNSSNSIVSFIVIII